jgi:hypothetical protein
VRQREAARHGGARAAAAWLADAFLPASDYAGATPGRQLAR